MVLPHPKLLLLQMLRRYWAAFPAERRHVPEQTAERILVFQRGAEVCAVVCGVCGVCSGVRYVRCVRCVVFR